MSNTSEGCTDRILSVNSDLEREGGPADDRATEGRPWMHKATLQSFHQRPKAPTLEPEMLAGSKERLYSDWAKDHS